MSIVPTCPATTAGDMPESPDGAQPRDAECIDCGHRFDLDSSPHFERCWQCAEHADAEAELLAGGAR